MKNRKMKGIEPIIAVVILIAITLVIAIGVIGWIMGWWGTLGATEALQVYPDSQILLSDNEYYLALHMQNKGSGDAVITRIEIGGVAITSFTFTDVSNCPSFVLESGNKLVIKPGNDTTIYIDIGVIADEVTFSPGVTFSVNIYTASGAKIPTVVQAVAGKSPSGCIITGSKQ